MSLLRAAPTTTASEEIASSAGPGIAIAEDDGGQGLGMVELVVLLEESGYACAPRPRCSAAPGPRSSSPPPLGRAACRVAAQTRLGGGHRLVRRLADGTSTLFCDLPTADVVVTFDGEEPLAPRLRGREFEPFDAIDATRSFKLVSDAAGERLPGDVDGGRDRLAVAIAAELTGIAQRALEMAVEYARTLQFGRPGRRLPGGGAPRAGMLLATEEPRSPHLLRSLGRR